MHVYGNAATAELGGTVCAWHTLFWGFCFALLFEVGSSPYLWAGQKTPGTRDDVEEAAVTPAPVGAG